MIFAQVVATPEWWNVVLQGGSFGLLAVLVVYLAPNVFKDMRLERETRDARFETLVNVMQARFEERNNAVIRAVEAHTVIIKEIANRICRYNPKSAE